MEIISIKMFRMQIYIYYGHLVFVSELFWTFFVDFFSGVNILQKIGKLFPNANFVSWGNSSILEENMFALIIAPSSF